MDSTGILPHRWKQKANFSAQGLVFLHSTGSQPALTRDSLKRRLPAAASGIQTTFRFVMMFVQSPRHFGWGKLQPRDYSQLQQPVNSFLAGQKWSPLECWITTSGGNGRYCRCICRRSFAETFMYLWCEGRCLHLAPARTPSPPTFSFPMKILLLLLHLHFHLIDPTNVGQTPPLCNTATEGSRQQVLV